MKKAAVQKGASALLALGLCISVSGCRLASDLLTDAADALPEVVDTARDTLSGVLASVRLSDLDQYGFSLQGTMDAFFAAVDSRDAEAVKALFASNSLAEASDIDEQIAALFDVYPGPTDECYVTRTPGGSGHIGFMESSFTTSAWVPVVSQGENYYCYVSLTVRDQADSKNVGLRKLVFVSEKARCSESFSLPEGDGLTVIVDAPGDYLTCRIGDEPFRYTPVDRMITQADILGFLSEDNHWDAFTARFGVPNAVTFDFSSILTVAYELPDENGEKRYAKVHINTETGLIRQVTLYDGKSYYALGVLWNMEDASSAS